MNPIIISTIFILFTLNIYGQVTDENKDIDTAIFGKRLCEDCPTQYDTVFYRLLECGLYYGSNGDLAFKSIATVDDMGGKSVIYITWIYGADSTDSINGGMKEMKYVIDTSTFEFASFFYWTDKDFVYFFSPNSSGGTVYLNNKIDRKTFETFGSSRYCKDYNSVYFRSSRMFSTDIETFAILEYGSADLDLAYDKRNYYQMGQKLTDEQIKQIGILKMKK